MNANARNQETVTADLCFAKQKKPELLRKNEPRNSNSKRIASFVLREVDQKRKHARTHAYTHTLIHTRTHTCTKRCCLYKCYFHWVIFDVDFHMKWPDGIEQFSTQNIYGHIFFTITKTHNRYYKIYIIEMHSRFWFSFVIKKEKGKKKLYISTTIIISWIAAKNIARRSTVLSFTNVVCIKIDTLTIKPAIDLSDSRWLIESAVSYKWIHRVGEILTINPSLRRGNPAGPHLLTEFTFTRCVHAVMQLDASLLSRQRSL